jgi:hypothetical protein
MAAAIPAVLRLQCGHFSALSRSGLMRARAEHRNEKGVDIPQCINDFAGRLAKAMTSLLAVLARARAAP